MRDKNGRLIQQTGKPYRITQTQADYVNPRKYWLESVNGELCLTIPISEFKTDSESFEVEEIR